MSKTKKLVLGIALLLSGLFLIGVTYQWHVDNWLIEQAAVREEGRSARVSGLSVEANPYIGTDEDKARSWMVGWQQQSTSTFFSELPYE